MYHKTPEERLYLKRALQHLARQHRNAINFAFIDANRYGDDTSMCQLGLSRNRFPALVLADPTTNGIFPLPSDVGRGMDESFVTGIARWIERFLAGELVPKSVVAGECERTTGQSEKSRTSTGAHEEL
jgi:hypothetical protein